MRTELNPTFIFKEDRFSQKGGMKNKIGFLITRLDVGGAERIFVNLVKGLDREKFEIVVFCLYDIGPLGKGLVDQDIKIYSCLMRNRIDLRGCYRLFNIFQKERLDILYILGQRLSQIVGIFIGKLSGIKKVVVGYHSQCSNHTLGFLEFSQKIFMTLVDRVICLSIDHKDYIAQYKKISPRKIEVIPNGVGINGARIINDRTSRLKEFGLNENGKIVGIVATLRVEKGYTFFLEAAKKVLEGEPEIRFLIVGDGPLKDSLRLKVKSLKLEDKVLFLGMREDIDELLPLFDVAVLSSVTECFPLAILEYMAHSRPIVATAVGSIPELIIDGETGFLVPAQDSNMLADRITILLRDPELSLRFGSAARARVIQDFSMEKMVKRYESLFLEVLST